jgi:hypothetical protein
LDGHTPAVGYLYANNFSLLHLHFDRNPDISADTYLDHYLDRHGYPHANPYANPHSHYHTNADPNPHSHYHTYADPNAYLDYYANLNAHAYRNCQAYPYSNANDNNNLIADAVQSGDEHSLRESEPHPSTNRYIYADSINDSHTPRANSYININRDYSLAQPDSNAQPLT